MRPAAYAALLIVIILGLGCRSGGLTPEPVPPLERIRAVQADGVLRVYGEPGTADPGTQAEVVYPHSGEADAAPDGSFTITLILPAAGSQASQAAPSEVQVNYVKDGQLRLTTTAAVLLADRVTKPLFSTGAGPNDMLFGLDSLYVANSLDNSVVRYGLDGSSLASVTLDEYSSPSYLALSGDALCVICNGSNQLLTYSSTDFSGRLHEGDLSLGGALAFPGPGVPAMIDDAVYIPMAMIEEFADPDTIYDIGSLRYVELIAGGSTGMVDLGGENGQAAHYDAASARLIVTSAGELQFDESWMPYVTTDSCMDVLDPADFSSPIASINLGAVAAGRFAVSPDGKTAYVGNALNGNLYKVDLEGYTVQRGESDPITLTDEFTYISDVAFTPDGRYVLATSFNTDELYVVDTLSDAVNPGPYPAPFDLSLDPELLAGCLGVEVDPTPRAGGGFTAYMLYGVANAVARVELF